VKTALFMQLRRSVKEAAAIERGKLKPSRTLEVRTANDVGRGRGKLGLSQTKFAALLGVSENTLQNWEQGRRQPTGPAKVRLKVAARHPEVIVEAGRNSATKSA
jgi:putative transcriptional regulator